MKSMNSLEAGIPLKEIAVQLSDEFPRFLTIGPFERNNGCPSLGHWLLLPLSVREFPVFSA